MKNLLLFIAFLLLLGSNLHSKSYHFVANDPYYKQPVKIDSINVYYMNTGKDTTFVSSSVHLDAVTTVELNNDYSDVRLFPNPANDILNIEFESNNISSTPLTIFDLEGRKLYSSNEQFGLGKHNINLNIAGLNQGFYFVLIGQSTHKFAKIGNSNSSEISLIQSTMPSLIKDKSSLSQYDYKFTIYSQGFAPYLYYQVRTPDHDTVKVDMKTESTRFDGKRIRVEFFFDKAKTTHFYDEHGTFKSYDTTYKDQTLVFADTLIIRGESIFSEVFEYKDASYIQNLQIMTKQLISFKLDTNQYRIKDINIVRYRDTVNDDRGEYHNLQQDFQFSIKESLDYDLNNSNLYSSIYYLDEVVFEYVNSFKDDYFVGNFTGCPGHKSYYNYELTNPSKSYIKIEIID